jgi:hypothetical protein
MEQGVQLLALVSSLEQCQTTEVIQKQLRSYIHQVRLKSDHRGYPEAAEVVHSSGETQVKLQR